MRDLLNSILDKAKENLAKDKCIVPVTLLYNKKVNALLAIPTLDSSDISAHESKSRSVFTAGVLARRVQADTVILVWDAAMRSVPPGTEYDATEAPLTYPKNMRTECLIVEGINVPSGEELVLIAPYKGGDGEPVEFLPNSFPEETPIETRFKDLIIQGYNYKE